MNSDCFHNKLIFVFDATKVIAYAVAYLVKTLFVLAKMPVVQLIACITPPEGYLNCRSNF
ncbi:hypothetical protein CWM47_34985 [Spirosoma pollinicola]|uniref:Uncharacterized protein n=1 Tax=Spirosoma pollinicola TaxID=2057025 RepID=A0A2K8Z9S6_9BACT|nr:hypothetical protein CWM47_34985 [Spirosoma pollinicola]